MLALETQREQSDREITALGTRLNLLADELVFQKRMAIFQSVLLLCCLVLVLFSRGVLSGSAGGAVAEQWPMASQFFNSYMVGSPRWPPGSPRLGSPQSAGSRGNSPAQQQRRASADVVRGGVAGRTLRPGDVGGQQQRSVSGPVPFSRSASYTEKMLPLTPTSEVYSGDDDDTIGSPPPMTTGHVAAQQPPEIRVDRPEPGARAGDLFGEPGRNQPAEEEDGDENSDNVSVVAAKTASLEEGEEGPSEGEDSSSGSASTALLISGREESPADEGHDEGHDEGLEAESSKPPLTRSPLSELGLGIHERKPLPALPEDPI